MAWVMTRAFRRMSASAYVELHQALNRTADPYMPVMVVLTGVLAVGLLVTATSVVLPGIILLGVGATTAITLAVNVPINHEVARWSSQQPPIEWRARRDRWVRFHWHRTITSVASFVAFLVLSGSS